MNSELLVQLINNVLPGKSKYLEDYDAYAVNVSGLRGVAIINVQNVNIYERFHKVEIRNIILNINGEAKSVIFMYTKSETLPDSYGMLCLDFLNINKRDMISKNPIQWVETWQELLGNQRVRRTVYDVIGELKVLLILQKQKKNPVWNSIKEGSFDITSNDAVYEVKTTQSRMDKYITVHNQFQLDNANLEKKLYIAFVRVESNNSGVSIDELVNDLSKTGYNIEEVESYLEKLGYYVGKAERYKKYVIDEIDLYLVDENFPKIDKTSFVDNKIPKNIIKLEYTLTLDGLQYERLI